MLRLARTTGILWCSRSRFRLAPIVALCRARGGGVKVAADVLAAARGARGTLTRPSTPVRWRVGASASHSRAACADVLRAPADSMQLRRSVSNCELVRGGATSPLGTNVDEAWVDVFDRRGVAPPSYLDPRVDPR